MLKRLKSDGFTLAELLIAAGILSLALCGLLYSSISLLALNKINRDFSLAYNAMQIKMENIKNTDFDSIADEQFTLSGFSSDDSQGTVNVTNLAESLNELLGNENLRAAAASLGKRIRAEQDIDNAVSQIEMEFQ